MKYHISRSIHIEAIPAKVKSLLEDFSKWSSWSPWTVLEPTQKGSVTGEKGSVGHSMTWDGDIIGAGTMTISEVKDNFWKHDIAFTKPFKSKAVATMAVSEEKGGTKVTWTMDSSMPFFLFFMIPSIKMMVGMDYDRGLTMLKAMAEQGKVNATTTNKGVVDFTGFSYIGVARDCTMKEVPNTMSEDFGKLMELCATHKKKARQWATIYTKMSSKTGDMSYVCFMSDEEFEGMELPAGFVRGTIDSSKALEITHDGPYDYIGNAWAMGMMTLRAKKMKQKGPAIEYYWNSPHNTKPEDLKSSVYFPIKN